MKKIAILLFLISSVTLFAQKPGNNSRKVGGGCEGCEAVFEYGSKKLLWVDTLPDFKEPGPKLEISGTIYKPDGKTPASNVILYVYHTDQKGNYPTKGNETGWGKRHGYIRGWIKTNADGKYKFYTLRPASYPNSRAPQHIHPIIKEPSINEYWIDEYLFSDDPFLDDEAKSSQRKRGGSGIITLTKKPDGTWVGKRDIVLGLNIPDY
jgi:protocatechuate 3,4-dioxygenase, beta subunit